jgi:hypothetical protein
MKYLLIIILCYTCHGNLFGQDLRQNFEQTRKIEDIEMLEIGSFYPSDFGLFRPELVTFDAYRNKFFIYDYGIRNLVSVNFLELTDNNSITVKEIGNGFGSGPGEFRNPTGLCLINDEISSKVIVVDPDLARVSIYDGNNDKLLKSFRPKRFVPFRVACNKSNIVLFNAMYHPLGSIAVYDYEGNLVSHIKESGRNKNNVSSMESGHLTINEEQIYYAGQDVEILKSFSLGNYSFKGKTMFVEAKNSVDGIQITNNGEEVVYKKSEDYLYRSRGIGANDELVLVFYSGREDAYGNLIDFYTTDDLSYLYSLKIEGLANEMNLNNDYLVLNIFDFDRRENYLKLYKIDN